MYHNSLPMGYAGSRCLGFVAHVREGADFSPTPFPLTQQSIYAARPGLRLVSGRSSEASRVAATLIFFDSSVSFSSVSFSSSRCLSQQRCVVRLPEKFGIGANSAIGGDFIVLHALRRRNQGRVHDVPFIGFRDDFRALLDYPFHAHALLSACFLVEHGEDFLKTLHVPFGLFEVLLKSVL